MKIKYWICALSVVSVFGSISAVAMTPTQRVQAVEKNIEGQTFFAKASLKVMKDNDTRDMKLKMWWKNRRLAMVKILEPKKDRGTGNLRIQTDLWQYLPNVNRIIRIPSSMMLQSWMGSDFSNDDLVRGGSLAKDYTHRLLAKVKVGGQDTEKIECLPKPNAPIVWGKVILWARVLDSAPIREEFYSEHGDLIKVMTGSHIQRFGSHSIPLELKMTSVKKQNSSTVITYDAKSVIFDQPISDDFFTQENLRKGMD